MSFAYFPLYTGDYLRDTRHLTPMRHGVYLLLLMHCWDQKAPLPLDEQETAGIANCRSADEIDALRYILSKYFVKMDDGWYNLRIQKEIERSENISGARSAAGKRGYEARAKQLLSKSQASASIPIPNPIPSPNHVTSKDLAPTSRTSRGSRLNVETLPPAWKTYCLEKHPTFSPEALWDGFKDYWVAKAGKDGVKLDWFATWRNWLRNQRTAAPLRKFETLADRNKKAIDQWLQSENEREIN